MKKITVSLAAVALAVSGVLMAAAPASAKSSKSYDPNIARIANPANVCRSIPGTLEFDAVLFGMPTPDLSWFHYSDCVRTLAQGKAVVEPVELFGNPYEECDLLLLEGVTYPTTLHSGEGGEEDFLLPDLTVKNRKECGNALYAFHAIFTVLFPDAPPPA